MYFLTKHWLHNFVMNCTPEGLNHTQSTERHLFHLFYEEFVSSMKVETHKWKIYVYVCVCVCKQTQFYTVNMI